MIYVYPIRDFKNIASDTALRYSIRSVYSVDADPRFVFIGTRRPWIDYSAANVETIGIIDCTAPILSSSFKIWSYLVSSTRDFVLMNDDFFLREPVRDEIPYIETKEPFYHPVSVHQKNRLATASLIRDIGGIKHPSNKNYCLHLPMMVDAVAAGEHIEKIKPPFSYRIWCAMFSTGKYAERKMHCDVKEHNPIAKEPKITWSGSTRWTPADYDKLLGTRLRLPAPIEADMRLIEDIEA